MEKDVRMTAHAAHALVGSHPFTEKEYSHSLNAPDHFRGELDNI